MAVFNLQINGQEYEIDADRSMPLLWALRDLLGLRGTKYSCGSGLCGTCTVLVDGTPTRSCVTPISSLNEKTITTIEGLSEDGNHPLQQASISLDKEDNAFPDNNIDNPLKKSLACDFMTLSANGVFNNNALD